MVERRRTARRRRDPTGWTCSRRSSRRSCFLFSTVWGSRVPHFCIYSGVSWAAVKASEGGGDGAAAGDCVCTSSRAVAEVESRRRGMPLAAEVCRTHRRQALNCRIDGVTDAMVCGGVGVDVRPAAAVMLRKCGDGARAFAFSVNLRRPSATAVPRPPPGMASRRIAASMRGVTQQLSSLPLRRHVLPARCAVCCPPRCPRPL